MRHGLWVTVALVLGSQQVLVASTREERAFTAAASAFQDGLWSRAEVEFAAFAEKYPNSKHFAEAVLLQAESDLKQQKFLPAIDLLTAHESQAGKFADRYVYWLGEAQFQNQDYAAAAATFARLAQDFPNSPRRLDAVVNEAVARTKLGQWAQASALLQEPDGLFAAAAKKNPADERVVRGQLLLAEALLNENKTREAAVILNSLTTRKLAPELSWQQVQLLCRVQLASGDTNAALASTTNLMQLADAIGRPDLRAQSVVEWGGVLEQLGRGQEALAAYQENLSTNVPAAWQQQAILKIAELAAAEKSFSEAEQSLEQFLMQFPDAASADVARLALGELYLKEYVKQPAATNGLNEAEAQFSQFLSTYPHSALVGKAYLDEGWYYWEAGKKAESLAAFKTAARLLPPSVDLARARFKIGDALFAQQDYAGARDNYEAVWRDFTNFPAVNETLAPQALYQTVRACMAVRDLDGTTNALAQILTVYPKNNLADNSVLMAGEELSDLQQPAAARALFEKFEELWPNSALRPQAELALARTYEQENNWPAAISVYDQWMEQFTNDTASLPQVEYARAMANYQAGNVTNAFVQLTNFLAQFPTNGLAPVAQWWIGDYFYNTSTNYADAEKNYELLFQTWPTNYLAYQAKLMAGRAAMGRQGYSDAIDYFTQLTSDTNCPPDVYLPALFAYGDALKLEPSQDTNDPVANFEQAIQVYKAIVQSYPQSEQAALAWGGMGDCYLQLAGQPQGAHFYEDATNAYVQVINSPLADTAARSQAQMGIGLVFEKRAALTTGQAQAMYLQKALQTYLDVLYGSNLRDDESADPFWVKKAGLQAASVAETLGEWPQAVKIYRRLEELLPPLRESLEKKIASAQANVVSGQN